MNAAIAAYESLLCDLARPFVGRNGAEEDDLVQEGRIFVWQSFKRGVCPSGEMIQNRMKDWVKFLDKQNPIPYETLLPLDDFPVPGPARVDIYVAQQDE
jgi:hypothetical protein